LAQAFIENLLDRSVRIFVTTHYGALKQFALLDERCRIAAMAFDLKSKRPTYQLILDVPGESSAFDTAASVGFPAEVLKRARELRGEPSQDLTRALEKLEEARMRFRERESETLERLERAKRREEQAQKVIEEYGLRQKAMLSEESQKLLKDLSRLRDELSDEIKKLSQEELKAGATKMFQKIADAATHIRVQVSEQSADDVQSRELESDELEIGQVVEIEGLGMGEILELPAGHLTPKTLILVQVGELKTRVTRERLKRVSGQRGRNFRKNKAAQEKARESRLVTLTSSSGLAASGSLICDVRGKTVEEALRRVEQSLNALLGGTGIVTIIHGHGTSKLRDSIREYLEKNRPDIAFRAGSWPGEGGDGVTLAELA
jgi:DNA mismatch repair protein MutS2